MMIPGFVTIIVIEVSYVWQQKFRSAQNVTDGSFLFVVLGSHYYLCYASCLDDIAMSCYLPLVYQASQISMLASNLFHHPSKTVVWLRYRFAHPLL